MGKARLSEWLWRFLASVMAFAVGWSIWIFYQLNPPPLITNSAFEAAASAKARQNTRGVIGPAPAAAPVAAPAAAPGSEASPAATAEPAPAGGAKVPPINADRLRFSESLSERR